MTSMNTNGPTENGRDNETTFVNAADRTRPEEADTLGPKVGQQPPAQPLRQLLVRVLQVPEGERPAENPEQQGRNNHNEGMFAFQNVMDEIMRNPPPFRHRQNAFQNEVDDIMTAADEIMRDLNQLEGRQN